jgi:catechol 2,3-dioxygenase-like lactoylglutathione lyase family enzyme
MFDHLTIRVSDRATSEHFYDTVLATLGIDRTYRTPAVTEWRNFLLTAGDEAHPRTQRLHVGFSAPTREQVDDFWREGVAAGYSDDGQPGPRPQYLEDYYGAFLLDPDGNSIEAVHHGALNRDGIVDHLWIRVADVAAAARFYELVAPYAGFAKGTDTPERVSFEGARGGAGGGSGSFSVVQGPPTSDLHMAFPTADDADVTGFHEAATAAGYRDNGPPGERPRYHSGYNAAYVLDPDGNNIEVVNHHREG